VFQLVTFAALLLVSVVAGAPGRAAPPADESQVRSAGIRQIASRHLVLHTDLAIDPAVDKLPAEFDQAVPQWAKYFGIDPAKTRTWQARGYLIGERRRFDALGLMPPAGNDQFINGISMGATFWFYDQPTAYYRRHLMLHEGTHAFMATFLGGCGPGWYMEGTAELLATHRLQKGTRNRFSSRPTGESMAVTQETVPGTFLVLGTMPSDRSEVPMLGRIKLIHDAREADRVLDLPAVLRIDNSKQLENEPYAWCWAAAKLMDSHPRYRERFRNLRRHVLNRDFNEQARREFGDDWGNLQAEWRAFVATLDHGYEFERMAIDFKPARPLGSRTHTVAIAADRGWQSSGVRLIAGKSYRVTADGRYEIANDGEPWPCEPGGVTIDYYDGRPLGMLVGAIDGRTKRTTLADTIDIGLGTTITVSGSGTLYLRVNDSAGQLHDNRGTLKVTIVEAREVPSPRPSP
jgi:hypothetical protein